MDNQAIQEQHNHPQNNRDEISVKELISKLKIWFLYLKSKWLIIVATTMIGGTIGIVYAISQKPIYTATLSFVLEDETSNSRGLGGAMGLASQFGFDMGSGGGGIFSGSNLLEFMKSRSIIEKALLNPFLVNDKSVSYAQYLLDLNNNLGSAIDEKAKNKFLYLPGDDRSGYSRQKDSVLQNLYERIVNGMLTILPQDKKSSIINIQVKSADEPFAKAFVENIAQEVSDFYIESKSKKARLNVNILEKKVDSVRAELNAAMTGVAVATDNTYNLNPALNVKRVQSSKRQIDVQANSAILTQLITNLEMSKMNLLKETPLIQVIDKPIFPLKKEKVGKLKSLLIGGFLAFSLAIALIFVSKIFKMLFL